MKIEKLMQQVKEKEPLVQCITNFVTVNDCANILLSIGATPTMAMDCREVEEAVAKVSALVCNMGQLSIWNPCFWQEKKPTGFTFRWCWILWGQGVQL